MWMLLISMAMTEPVGNIEQSRGLLQLPMTTLEQCQQQRDRVQREFKVDKFRTAARCVRIPR